MRMLGQLASTLGGPRFYVVMTLILSLATLIATVILQLITIVPFAAAAIVGSVIFLASNHVSERGPVDDSLGLKSRLHAQRLFILFGMAFFLLNSVALVMNNHPYEKPVTYYFLLALSSFFVVFQIGAAKSRGRSALVLFEIMFLAVSVFASNQMVFPLGIGGADSVAHFNLVVAPIVELGRIPDNIPFGFLYGSFPIHHIFVASSSEVLATDPLSTYFGLGYVVMLLPVAIVFTTCRSIAGTTSGLVAALLLSGASYYVYWSSHAAALTFAVPLVAMLVLLAIKYIHRPSRPVIIVSLVLMIALIFTHPYSSTIFAFLISGVLVIGLLNRGLSGSSRKFEGFVLIFLLLLLTQWMYYSFLIENAVVLGQEWYYSLASESMLSPPGAYDAFPIGLVAVNMLGDFLLTSSGIVGFFFVLSTKLSSQGRTTIGMTAVLVIVSAIGVATSLVYLLPNRIYVFLLFAGLAPFAGIAFARWLVGNGGAVVSVRRALWKKARAPIIAFAVASTVFMSTTSTIAGFETSPFTGDQPYVKLYNTNYETHSVEWVCCHAAPRGVVIIPRSLSSFSWFQLSSCSSSLDLAVEKLPLTIDMRIDVDSLPQGATLLYSEFDVTIGFQLGVTGKGKAGQGILEKLDPTTYLELSQFCILCDEGPVKIYLVT